MRARENPKIWVMLSVRMIWQIDRSKITPACENNHESCAAPVFARSGLVLKMTPKNLSCHHPPTHLQTFLSFILFPFWECWELILSFCSTTLTTPIVSRSGRIWSRRAFGREKLGELPDCGWSQVFSSPAPSRRVQGWLPSDCDWLLLSLPQIRGQIFF